MFLEKTNLETTEHFEMCGLDFDHSFS